jgi:hypothetical protein
MICLSLELNLWWLIICYEYWLNIQVIVWWTCDGRVFSLFFAKEVYFILAISYLVSLLSD